MAFKIKLAGIGFQVNGIYEESLKKHCGDYLDIEENSDNKNAPLGGICIIERGTECGIRKLDSKEAIPYLLGQIHFGDSSAQAGKTLELLDILIKKVPVYILNCDISEHAVRTSYEAMTGEEYRES